MLLLLMRMWLKPMGRMRTVDASILDFSKAKINPGRDQSQNSEKILLAFIGNPEHIKSECKKYKRELAEGKLTKKTEQKAESSLAMTATDEDYLVIEDEDCYSAIRDDAMSWVVDSGASFHITSHR